MSYQIYQFEDAALPLYNIERDLSPGDASSGLLDSIGGTFYYRGNYHQYPRRSTFPVRGTYLGEQAHEVDHLGNRIVDESGNYIVTHNAQADLRAQVEALQRYIGKRGTLYRRRLDDTDVIHTKTAQLLSASWPQSYEDVSVKAEITCIFETAQAAWRDDTLTTTSQEFSTQTIAMVVHNDGPMRIDDATIEVAAMGGAITLVTVANAAAGIAWRFSGVTYGGKSTIIDCGAGTVRYDGADDYSDFSLDSSHTARSWLPLEPGDNTFVVSVTGPGTVYIKHRTQWP